MSKFTAEEIWNFNKTELLHLLESGFTPGSKVIRFYAPSFAFYRTKYYCSSPQKFPTISITGAYCALDCRHCGRKVLETMHPAPTPAEFFDLCWKLRMDGAEGCLVSGGCLPDGSLPLDEFVDAMGRVKRELGLTVFVHTGIIKLETAIALKRVGVDAALIDVIGSAETTKKTFNLDLTPRHYSDSLAALEKAGLIFVPHVVVGLDNGELGGEFEALKMISAVKPAAIVIIAFMSLRGTAMEKTAQPQPEDIAKIASMARIMFPETPLILGCMRPRGSMRGETDILALKAGVDAIAFPSEEAVKYALSKGWKTSFSSFCCAQMYTDAAWKTKR